MIYTDGQKIDKTLQEVGVTALTNSNWSWYSLVVRKCNNIVTVQGVIQMNANIEETVIANGLPVIISATHSTAIEINAYQGTSLVMARVNNQGQLSLYAPYSSGANVYIEGVYACN